MRGRSAGCVLVALFAVPACDGGTTAASDTSASDTAAPDTAAPDTNAAPTPSASPVPAEAAGSPTTPAAGVVPSSEPNDPSAVPLDPAAGAGPVQLPAGAGNAGAPAVVAGAGGTLPAMTDTGSLAGAGGSVALVGGAGAAPVSGGAGGQLSAGAGGVDTGTLPAGELRIYFVDVEGGQATLLAFPDGRSMLVDAGLPGERDPGRIVTAIRGELGSEALDWMLTTHYDGDHVGGVADVAAEIAIATFLDHGDDDAPDDYLAATLSGAREIVEAGDPLQIGDVALDFVSSGRALIDTPLAGAGAANPYCAEATLKGGEDENAASVGFVLHFGAFDFVNLADLLWDQEHALVCPNNLLGEVELYLTTHHGLTRSGATQLVRALNPVAAIMNNGPRKGGGGETWQTLLLAPGADDVWQLHRNVQVPAEENTTEQQIANLAEGNDDTAELIVVVAASDGSFTVENRRTGFSKGYGPR